jgi:arsenite-transporting ATPase
LSDAFAQKFSKDPTRVNGYDNLFCMEIDPEVEIGDELGELGGEAAGGLSSLMQDLTKAVPGIDEVGSIVCLTTFILPSVITSNNLFFRQ